MMTLTLKKSLSSLPRHAKHEWIASLLLFSIILAVSALFFATRSPLFQMEGFAEEYLFLGYNLAETGSFSGSHLPPAVFRPPGYAFFIACVIKLYLLMTGKVAANLSDELIFSLVYWSQAVLLSVSATLFYHWIRRRTKPVLAFCAALMFGCSPYQQILVGFIHYETLHVLLVVSATSLLGICMERNEPRRYMLLICGMLFGIATLTRPMTLILPPFVMAGYFLIRTANLKTVIMRSALISAGMLIVIAPYTIRNYNLTGRFIPVNAQGGVAVWASTQKVLDRAPNRYRWWDAWYPDGEQLYGAITGEQQYSVPTYMKHIVSIEDEFRKRAMHNIAARPMVYLQNMTHNVQTFMFDINSIVLGIFLANQQATHIPVKIVVGGKIPLAGPYKNPLTLLFELSIHIMAVCSLAGIITGLSRREPFIIAPLLVLVCFCAAHAVSYMDMFYYYIKVPFLFLFTAYFLSTLGEGRDAAGAFTRRIRTWSPTLVTGVLLLMCATQLFYALHGSP